jgi:hypothetical protein
MARPVELRVPFAGFAAPALAVIDLAEAVVQAEEAVLLEEVEQTVVRLSPSAH